MAIIKQLELNNTIERSFVSGLIFKIATVKYSPLVGDNIWSFEPDLNGFGLCSVVI